MTREAAAWDLAKNEGAQGEACDDPGDPLILRGGIKGALDMVQLRFEYPLVSAENLEEDSLIF